MTGSCPLRFYNIHPHAPGLILRLACGAWRFRYWEQHIQLSNKGIVMTMRDQCDKLFTAWDYAAESGDAQSLARLYTEDALLLNPGCPLISGRQAIEEHYTEILGDGIKFSVNIHDFQERGEIAYAAGTYESENENGNWLEVFRRQSDGSLLIHRQCSNSN